MKKYLIINTGSTSKKYAFYIDSRKVYNAHFETENGQLVVNETFKNKKEKNVLSIKDYSRAVLFVTNSLKKNKIIKNEKEIDCVGIRIVAPGKYFLTNRLIDEKYLKLVKEATKKVPLHLSSALLEIKNIRKFLGVNIPIFGISDSAFHNTIPEYAKCYAIPIKDSRRLDIQMYGYHGISIQSVVSRAKKILGELPKKTIVCHLGGGASVTAVLDGKSMDTSMGFTPLEGLVMATRVGDIGAGVVLYLSEKLKKTGKELESYFNNECGLLGISGKSSDLRELISSEKEGHENSALALQVYTNRIKQYIGKMAATLGGVDLVILAGTVGERSFIMRERICKDMQFLGIEIDEELNNKSEGVEVDISKKDSKAKILIIKTDETAEIAKETLRLIKGLK